MTTKRKAKSKSKPTSRLQLTYLRGQRDMLAPEITYLRKELAWCMRERARLNARIGRLKAA